MRKFVFLVVVSLFVVLRAEAGMCPGYEKSFYDPPGAICGYLHLNTANYGVRWPESVFNVKFCHNYNGTNCKSGSNGTLLWDGTTDLRRFIAFDGLDNSTSPTYTYYVFAWSNYEKWGSETKPFGTLRLAGIGGTQQHIYASPAPLKPNPVYPSGQTVYASSFPVMWNSGLDEERDWERWPVTYDLYYKHWTTGSPEPGWSLSAGVNMQCNTGAEGHCQTFVTNMPAGYYKWKIVAKMDVTYNSSFTDTVHTTESDVASFYLCCG